MAEALAGGAPARTDEHDVDARPGERGRRHGAVRHARGEHARDDGGDGSCGAHADTAEGSRPLPRPRSRPRRGASREEPPAHPGLFQLVRDAGRRGKAPPGTLTAGPVARTRCPPPRNPMRASKKWATMPLAYLSGMYPAL
jgi:hypothetical protein